MSHSQLWAIGAIAKHMDIQHQAHKSTIERQSTDSQESQPDDYTVALSKEVHRFYDAFRIAPPRETVKDFEWRGHFIPAGTTISLNTFAVNRGKCSLCIRCLSIYVLSLRSDAFRGCTYLQT
jgi:cytochrome P450